MYSHEEELGGAGRERRGERKGGSIYVLIYLFEEEEFVQ